MAPDASFNPTHIRLLLAPLLLAGSLANASEYSLAYFKKVSLELGAGSPESAVLAALGKPASTEPAAWKDVKVLRASKGLVYWHPEWATVHLLIGIKAGKVTGISMCRASGSRNSTTECQPPAQFWKEVE